MSKNNITGDSIRSKPLSKEGEENWDRIFGKKEDWDEKRIDTIGSNGNSGEHYDALCDTCGKEVAKVTECAFRLCPVVEGK